MPSQSSPRDETVRGRDVALVLVSIASVQVGAAFAKGLFAVTAPLTVSWLRLASASLLLWVLFRPWRALRRGVPARSWLVLGLFALALVTMNVAIYLSFTHIPIGLAVTLEFLGPLGVAVAGSRRWLDGVWVVLAGAGVALLGFSPGHLDVPGVLFALLAGAAWALYIVAGGAISGRWREVDALGLGCAAGALVLTPVALAGGLGGLADPWVLATGVMVGLLSTVLPYTLELRALGRIPRRTFGILMSLEPAAAALAALLLLGEQLRLIDWVAMGCVVAASAGATLAGRRAGRAGAAGAGGAGRAGMAGGPGGDGRRRDPGGGPDPAVVAITSSGD